VFQLLAGVGVVRLDTPDGRVFVGECRVKDGRVRVLPQTLREPEAVFTQDVTTRRTTSADHADAVLSGIQRFRHRLADARVPGNADRRELDAEIQACIADLSAL
jgi:hypothetical protein